MRTWSFACSFALAAVLALAFAGSSRAGDAPRTPQGNQNPRGKVWTNDDLDQLRARGGQISIFGSEAPQAAPQAAAAASGINEQNPGPVYTSRLEDPRWYADRAAALQARLDALQTLLNDQQAALDQAASGITQPGLAMDQPNLGVSPADGIAVLQAQAADVQSQLDDLGDLARANSIEPGVLRG